MINIDEVITLIKNPESKNIICKQFEMKPFEIAKGIAKLSNLPYDFGYYIIGVERKNHNYEIHDISKGFQIQNIIETAKTYLTTCPKVEVAQFIWENKNIYVIKIYRLKNNAVININSGISDTVNLFLRKLLLSCIKLQASLMHASSSEDERNDFIRDLLESQGYDVKDQTRRGKSKRGINAGEVDLLVEDDDGLPFTIIEALNLDSLNKAYLSEHINKIYNYDTSGNVFNICLSYVMVKDFKSFWEKYCEYAKQYEYPASLISFDSKVDESFNRSEIRILTTTHDRSGKVTYLYHIVVKMQ